MESKLLYLLLILITVPTGFVGNLHAQNNQRIERNLPKGTPFTMQYVRGDDYFGSLQTWGVIKDDQGLLLFGNTNYGIQQFDGTHWQQITTPGGEAVISITKTEKGQLFAATETHLGTLIKENNQYKFHMLIPPESDSTGLDSKVLKIEKCGKKICFLTQNVLYVFDTENKTFSKRTADTQYIDLAVWKQAIWLIDGNHILQYEPGDSTSSIVNNTIPEGVQPDALLGQYPQPAIITTNYEVLRRGNGG